MTQPPKKDRATNGGRKEMQDAVKRRAARSEQWERDGERSIWQNISMIGALGWLIVVPTLIGVAAGRWLDDTFDTGITFTGALIFLGAAFGGYLAWHRMQSK